MFVSDVRLRVPITVHAPTPGFIAYNQPPPFWNATVIGNPVQLTLPGVPPLPPMPQAFDGRGLEGKHEPSAPILDINPSGSSAKYPPYYKKI